MRTDRKTAYLLTLSHFVFVYVNYHRNENIE